MVINGARVTAASASYLLGARRANHYDEMREMAYVAVTTEKHERRTRRDRRRPPLGLFCSHEKNVAVTSMKEHYASVRVAMFTARHTRRVRVQLNIFEFIYDHAIFVELKRLFCYEDALQASA